MNKHFLFFILALFCSSDLYAAVHFGITGNLGKNHRYLETSNSIGFKGSVAADIGTHFRVSYSFKYETEDLEGYKEYTTNTNLYLIEFQSETLTRTHSIDLIGILYGGDTFVPYIFVGAAYKIYDMSYKDGRGIDYDMRRELGPVENYGVGLSVNISRNFALKISNTWSPGIRLTPEDLFKNNNEGTKINDYVTEFGFTYILR